MSVEHRVSHNGGKEREREEEREKRVRRERGDNALSGLILVAF